ncbi:hypothetical protein BIV57_01325 [Mangrovactinospora gilvigrisea]|uniref:PPM-type phosphatase domain-containing protein n=1 Tax=Mangrovactinospora gilvigrisea TaxID=1428644 RepID=A0A1J7BLQ3_9ACTN|nr:hypothetical protein BIV57_01325 [Mangrovactinospora gilvigrisea]
MRSGRRTWAYRLLPALLLAGGIVLEVLTPPEFSSAPLYSAAAMSAAALLSFRGTLLIGLAATGADAVKMAVLGYHQPLDNSSEVATVATVAAVALLTNAIVRRSDSRARSASTAAAALQRAVLPQPPPELAGLRLAASYRSALTDTQIGGDLYAVQETPFGVRCIVGDVRGKGIAAAEAVAVVVGAFREISDEEGDLRTVATRLEDTLRREGGRRAGLDEVEGFTTAVLVEIPKDRKTVRLVNCGHPAPLLLQPSQVGAPRVRMLHPSVPALPLGMALDTPGPVLDEVALPAGTTLLLYTDGVSEARNSAGEFYDPALRLAALPVAHEPEQLVRCLLADLTRHTSGRYADDIAVLALTRLV